MTAELYLDYNGSTPLHPEVRGLCAELLEHDFGNASAAHRAGASAKERIDHARDAAARALNARASEVFFTSGGTESNNWALAGSVPRSGRRHLVVTAIEHKSVLATAQELERAGCALDIVPVAADGRVRAADVRRVLRAETALVSVMMANNETGVLQPVEEIAAFCRSQGVRFHVDAVCAIGRVPLDVEALGCDLLSLSSHKLYAPKGSGLLYVRTGTELAPLIHGCGQQSGQRGGTENTLAAAGFGRALELLVAGALPRPEVLARLRDELEARLLARVPGARVNGSGPRLCNTLSLCFPGQRAFELQSALSALGISVAAGAAAATAAPSHVLTAMGLAADDARASLRFSLGAGTRSEDLPAVVEALAAVIEAALARSA